MTRINVFNPRNPRLISSDIPSQALAHFVSSDVFHVYSWTFFMVRLPAQNFISPTFSLLAPGRIQRRGSMKNLVALARKIYSDTFVRIQGTRTHKSEISRRRRFTMESLESRVLLSAETFVIPPWMGEPLPIGESALIQPLTSDSPTGVETHDESEAARGDEVIVLTDLDEEVGPGADLAVGLTGNEPTVAVNPLNPNNIAVAQFNAGMQTLKISLDGGLTFPITRNAVLAPGQTNFNGDDSLAFDAAGRLFWSYLSNGTPTGPNISVVQVNPTTGAIVGSPTLVATTNLDKGWIAADANPLSPFTNNLYVIWHDFAQQNTQFN